MIPARFQAGEIIPGPLGATLERDLGAEGTAFFFADGADLAEGSGLPGFFGIVFQNQRRVKYFLEIFPRDHDAVAAQQDDAFIGDDFKQRFTTRGLRIGVNATAFLMLAFVVGTLVTLPRL